MDPKVSDYLNANRVCVLTMGTVFLEFAPAWYRYTDFNPHPPLFISSDSN